jgi:hypothetical protein
MGAIVNTLETLERVMEYKRTSYDICMAAARHTDGRSGDLLQSIAMAHDADLKRIPVLFNHLDFKSTSADDTPLTEMRTGYFQNLGEGVNLDLTGAVLRVEQEAVRLLQRPLERTDSPELRSFLETVVRTARENIDLIGRIRPDQGC